MICEAIKTPYTRGLSFMPSSLGRTSYFYKDAKDLVVQSRVFVFQSVTM